MLGEGELLGPHELLDLVQQPFDVGDFGLAGLNRAGEVFGLAQFGLLQRPHGLQVRLQRPSALVLFAGQAFAVADGLFNARDLFDLRGEPHRRFRDLRGAMLGLDLDHVLPTGARLQGLRQCGEPRDIRLNRPIEPKHFTPQLPQLALPRQDGSILRSRPNEQHPIAGD